MKRLSENFTFDEVTATSYDKLLELNRMEAAKEPIISNLTHSAAKLQILRDLLKRPIIISSGYRCEALNKAVGGTANSSHKNGMAFDITVKHMNAQELFCFIKNNQKNLRWTRKAIIERIGGKEWVHYEIKRDLKEPMEFYETNDGKTYAPIR